MFENKIIHGYLIPKKIFLSLNRLDKSLIKLSSYSLSKLKINKIIKKQHYYQCHQKF